MFKYAIFGLIILAFAIRVLFIFQGGVSFHYDMARDAFEAQKIWEYGHLKILGPPTSTQGLYHGVLYYYLIALFYFISQGNPVFVAIAFSLINAFVVIPIMVLAKDLFKSNRWSILAGFLFAVSFESTQYGPWISNPAPAVLSVSLVFLFLRLWQKGKAYGLYMAILLAALSAQFQFFLIYLFLLIPIFGYLFKIKTTKKIIWRSCLIGIISLANFFIAAIKFNTWTAYFLGFVNIGTAGQIDFRPQFTELFFNYINRISELFTYNFFPTNVLLGGILTIIVLYMIRREHLLLFFLFSNLPIFLFGGHSNIYANVGLVVPAILSVVFVLNKVWRIGGLVYVILFLSLASNFYTIFKYNSQGQIILVIPNDMNLKNELALVDQTYKLAGGSPFSVNSLTLPLWTNTTWAYLYSWYGKNKYGYVPTFYGHDQIGLLGADVLQKIDKPLNITFFIIEPHVGIPEDRYVWEIGSEDSKTDLIKQFDYGQLKLQFRKPKNNEQ